MDLTAQRSPIVLLRAVLVERVQEHGQCNSVRKSR